MKKFLFILAGIILIFIIISFFLPSTARVERSTLINAPVEVVFDQVNDLKNYVEWMPWRKYDTDMTITWSGNTRGEGAGYYWSSEDKNVGSGSMKILESKPYSYIHTLIDFGEMGTADGYWTFEETGQGVKVTWAFETTTNQPPVIGKYFGLLMDRMVGPDFEEGLRNLKERAESAPPPASIDLEEITTEPFSYLAIRDTVTMEELGAVHERIFTRLMTFIAQNKVETTGQPFCITFKWDPENDFIDLACGIPVNPETVETDKLQGLILNEQPAVKALKAEHWGDYHKLGETYEAIQSAMEARGIEHAGAPWEQYVTDPGEEPDTSKWLTVIYFPI